mgnify:FL=1
MYVSLFILNLDLDEIVAVLGDNTYLHGKRSICDSYIGTTLSLDDLLVVSAIYPSIAKKSPYPCPASLSKKYLAFMKYVKRVYSLLSVSYLVLLLLYWKVRLLRMLLHLLVLPSLCLKRPVLR